MLDALEVTLASAMDSSPSIDDDSACLLVGEGASGCTLGLGISFGGVQRLVVVRGLGGVEGGVPALFFSNMAIRAAMPPCFPPTRRSDGLLLFVEDDGSELAVTGSESVPSF